MAWNEPGGNNRDPWGGNGRGDQGPPDLDELIRKLSGKFGGLFGGGNRGGGDGSGGGSSAGGSFNIGSFGIWVIVAVVAGIWLFTGFYTVEAGKRGVETRFGAFSTITLPGLRYHLPSPIESVEIVDVERRRFKEIGYRSRGNQSTVQSVPHEALMLSEDENIVDVRLSVQYDIANPEHYLFKMKDPDQALVQVVESAIREVVGRHKMDFLLTEGRADIVAEVKQISQKLLDETYRSGLRITNVNLQDAQPPGEVQEAFADAIKAREDEQRSKNEAETYARGILPQARGQAARRLQEAQAYKEQVIAQAEGETARFQKLLAEYKKAPDVTRERLYLETIETILGNTETKVIVDVEGNNNLMYLPLDRIMSKSPGRQASTLRDSSGAALAGQSPISSSGSGTLRQRDTSRTRGTR